MRHFPSDRAPARIEGLEHTPSPRGLSRTTACLLAALLFLSGFFVGAIAFGEVLIRSIPSTEAAP